MAQIVNSSQWGYSVPLEEADGNARPQPRRQTTQGSQDRDFRTMKSGTRRPGDHGIQSDSEETRQRRKNVKANNVGATRQRSRNALRPSNGRDRSMDPPPGVDDSAWIHRDKLAQIEIQEMVEAGIPVRHSRRSMSAGPADGTRSSRSLSPSQRGREDEDGMREQPYERYDPDYDQYEEFERKRISTIDQADEEDQFHDELTNGALRSPHETTGATRETTPPWSPSHGSRPSTSRIPVSTTSAISVPHNVVDRESPLPRSRHGSQPPSGNWEELMYARRARSNSLGSQALLEDDRDGHMQRPGSSEKTSSVNNSPPKSRLPGKSSTLNGQRKGSGVNATSTRPGSSSSKKPNANSSTAQRSNSRSSHPPTGDPPWITDMYKPDPRLPPDQQMLPTHARRMAQEQWEREGASSSAYDRELRPLNDRDPSPNLPRDGLGRNETLDTPTPALNPTSPHLSASEAGSPTRSGGYKITPTIASPPEIQRSPTAPYTSHMGGMSAEPPKATLDEKGAAAGGAGDGATADGKKGGGCACCVVM